MDAPTLSVDDSLVGICVKYQEEFGELSNADVPDTATMNKFFDELSGDVPSDLKDDVSTLKTALSGFYAAIDKAGGDMAKAAQDPGVQKAMTAMQDPEVVTASGNMEKWFQEGCPD